MMVEKEKITYAGLYDIVAANRKNSGAKSHYSYSKEQFLNEVGKAPDEITGFKDNAIYIMLRICKNRRVQLILQKMPKWILNIGRKLLG